MSQKYFLPLCVLCHRAPPRSDSSYGGCHKKMRANQAHPSPRRRASLVPLHVLGLQTCCWHGVPISQRQLHLQRRCVPRPSSKVRSLAQYSHLRFIGTRKLGASCGKTTCGEPTPPPQKQKKRETRRSNKGGEGPDYPPPPLPPPPQNKDGPRIRAASLWPLLASLGGGRWANVVCFSKEVFKTSVFLVFCNRTAAIVPTPQKMQGGKLCNGLNHGPSLSKYLD